MEVLSEEELIRLFSDYLAESHASGFGEHFSIYAADGRDRAARWFTKHVMGMLAFEQARINEH